MKPAVLFALCLIGLAPPLALDAAGQATTVFKGIPSIKVSEDGSGRLAEPLGRAEAMNVGCVISEIGDQFYWTSRENKELRRSQSGAFVTYVAVDGSGYIRTIDPGMKAAAALLGGPEAKYDYVEHILVGLRSVTYYGRAE